MGSPFDGEATMSPRKVWSKSRVITTGLRLSSQGPCDTNIGSGRRQPPDELPRPSVVSLHHGGETCLAAARIVLQPDISNRFHRRLRTSDGSGKSHSHGCPEWPPGANDTADIENFVNLMTGCSPTSAYRGTRSAKILSGPPGRA